ncbi:MAG: retroviral-like aspartic protease family protein [Nitrososphaerota archaeon]|nr:retroviral-like aspartic protease family protein [Nitrososphaerota archaeon]
MKVGETWVTVRVHGARATEEVKMLVDTGSTYTRISESLARKLGIAADEIIKVKLADGSLREAGLGDASIEFRGSKRAVTVLIGFGDQEPLLGLTALEALRLKVNPVSRELEKFTPYVLAISK